MVESHDPDCQTDSRLFVNGTRLPAGEADLYLRKEGNLDVTRYVEAEFASPFRGEDYATVFKGLNPEEQTSFDTATIDVRDYVTEQYVRAFRGYVTGVGNTSTGPEERWRLRAQGPAHLLDKIPASKRFTEATAQDVLNYIAEKLKSKLPFPVSVPETDTDVQGEVTAEEPITGPFAPIMIGPTAVTKFTDYISTPKTFQANKDTLTDVVDWLEKKTDLSVWLVPTEDGLSFRVSDKPSTTSHTAHYLDGNTHIVNNDALVELRPVNTSVVKGGAKKSLGSVGPFEINSPSDTFTTVKAQHTPLYRRSGQTELHAGTETKTDALSKDEVGNEAKHSLKKAIEGTTEGSMQTLLRGPITPFDTIEALPTCNERVSTNDDPITYEVSRVQHKIRTSDPSETKLNVGVHVADEDIEIIDSWKSEV